ncbi:MAG: hypothetical protein LBC20_08475 [Planctomycetaceae bacterium]|jgi:hypothetical protein|nr:hypothetical protein [Planctomycetaceae bacterium]
MVTENTAPVKLLKPHLILCEGRDAERFLIVLLHFLIADNRIFDNFQVLNFGGISELKPYLHVLPARSGFQEVKSVSVIRDAEQDVQAAVSSVKNAFQNNGFAVPTAPALPKRKGTDPKNTDIPVDTGFVLFPSCGRSVENGTLEDLCLNILAGENAHSILTVVDNTLKKRTLQRPHKNRLHTYFSMTNEYVSMKIGEAAHAQAFNFCASPIVSYKNFLLEMINEDSQDS